MNRTIQNSLFTVLDSAPGYFFITDNRAKILYANEALFYRTGYQPAEAIGKDPGNLWGGEMPQNFYNRLWKSIDQDHRPFSESAVNTKKNGEKYKEQLYILPIQEHESTEYFLGFQKIHTNTGDQNLFEQSFLGFSQIANQSSRLFFENILAFVHPGQTITSPFESTTAQILSDVFVAPTKEKYFSRTRDSAFIAAAQQDSQKFDILYTTYRGSLLQYFLKRTGYNQAVAEDLSQETFLQAFSHLKKFTPSNASYQTYLLRIAHNILVNYYRRHTPKSLTEEQMEDIQAPNSYERLLVKLSIESGLIHLSQNDRDILHLMYQEGLSVKEIASELKKTENAVKLQISRARKKLLPFISAS